MFRVTQLLLPVTGSGTHRDKSRFLETIGLIPSAITYRNPTGCYHLCRCVTEVSGLLFFLSLIQSFEGLGRGVGTLPQINLEKLSWIELSIKSVQIHTTREIIWWFLSPIAAPLAWLHDKMSSADDTMNHSRNCKVFFDLKEMLNLRHHSISFIWVQVRQPLQRQP